MANVIDLKKELYNALQDSSEIVSYNAKLRDKYEKQEKKINRERGQWDRDRKKWSKKLGGANTEIQKLRTHDLELIKETRRLQIENARKDISLAKSKAKHATKLGEIKSLRNEMKLLKGKLDLSQKDSSKKGSEIDSLKSKIVELALKISKLERLKPEDISGSIIGGDDEKNTLCEEQSSITKPDDISAVNEYSKNLKKINSNMCLESKIRGFATDTSSAILTYTNDEITELSKNNTKISPKLENNSRSSAKAHMSSLIESNSQIPIGGIGAIPAVASTLMSPLSYILLALLIIAIIWFVRCTWNIGRLKEPGFKGSPYSPLRNKKVIGYGICRSDNRLSI
ncbi:7392_t:CDS:2 [Paraglomus brasilianum]|uniref:7392_t:CDS:1 n=1 Tax=Paraglomus brasilianum TaxID=144538 RepID=A0A9N9DB82_9GLOM|nr:7392_t:CDS:2 [Paraglomus brasilianum]